MIGTKTTLHVAFNLSIAGSIRQALQASGCDVHVIGLADDLSFGPIDAPTSQARAEWVGDVVGFEWSEVVQKSGIFWHELKYSCASLVAWVNLNDSSDYCGLLEFIRVIDQAPFMVIDATEIEFTDRHNQKYTSRSLGIVSPEQMRQAELLGSAQQLDLDKIEKYRCTWNQLKVENAPLRIVNQRGLISAPIDYFDDWIVRNTTDEWKKGALVVGEALYELFRSEEGPHVGDIWLWGRVRALAEEGILETVGDTSEMRKTMVRRSSGYAVA